MSAGTRTYASPPSAERDARGSPLSRAAWLVLLVALTTLPSIAMRELMPTDEPRFALVARQMVDDPAPVVPHLGYDALTREGELYADKPPVFFWLVSLFSFVTGGVNEISARLPSLLAAIATVLVTWRIGRLLLDEATGFLGAALLAATNQFFLRAAWCSIDMTLTAFTTGAALCWLDASRSKGRRAVVLGAAGGALAAAGTLSKGPVGFLFPAVFLLSDRFAVWWGRRSAVRDEGPDDGSGDATVARGASPAARPAPIVAAAAAFAVPVGAWIAAIGAIAGTPYVVEILFKQNVTRYIAAWNNIAPWYYYFGRLPVGLLPWLLLLPAALAAPRTAVTRARSAAARGLLIACSAFFVFFSASTGKRGVYLLPMYPALALLLAAGWRGTGPRREDTSGETRAGGAAASPFTAPAWARIPARAHVLAFLVAGLLAPLALPLIARRRAPELVLGAALLGAVGAVSGIAGFLLDRRGERDRALMAHAAGVVLLVCVGSFLLVPAANRKAAVRDFGAELAALARPGDYLVVDQEGYEQILFYSHLRGARREMSDLSFSWVEDSLVMETGGAEAGSEEGGGGAVRPPAGRRRAEGADAPRATFAGEIERAHRRVAFPSGARVLFVTAAPRADRLRKRLGPSSRVILAAKIYGKPYLVIASR